MRGDPLPGTAALGVPLASPTAPSSLPLKLLWVVGTVRTSASGGQRSGPAVNGASPEEGAAGIPARRQSTLGRPIGRDLARGLYWRRRDAKGANPFSLRPSPGPRDRRSGWWSRYRDCPGVAARPGAGGPASPTAPAARGRDHARPRRL